MRTLIKVRQVGESAHLLGYVVGITDSKHQIDVELLELTKNGLEPFIYKFGYKSSSKSYVNGNMSICQSEINTNKENSKC